MQSPANIEFTVKVSYMEIYMEKVRDLLNRKSANPHDFFFRGSYFLLIIHCIFFQHRTITCLSMKIKSKACMSKGYWKFMCPPPKKSMK